MTHHPSFNTVLALAKEHCQTHNLPVFFIAVQELGGYIHHVFDSVEQMLRLCEGQAFVSTIAAVYVRYEGLWRREDDLLLR